MQGEQGAISAPYLDPIPQKMVNTEMFRLSHGSLAEVNFKEDSSYMRLEGQKIGAKAKIRT